MIEDDDTSTAASELGYLRFCVAMRSVSHMLHCAANASTRLQDNLDLALKRRYVIFEACGLLQAKFEQSIRKVAIDVALKKLRIATGPVNFLMTCPLMIDLPASLVSQTSQTSSTNHELFAAPEMCYNHCRI